MIEEQHFPALDPEPPAPSGWRRAAVPLIAVAVVGATVTAFVAAPAGGGSPRRAPPLTNVGAVVVWRQNGSLALVRPDGTHVEHAMRPQSVPEVPVSSPDGHYAVDLAGDVWTLSTDGVRLTTEHAWGSHVLIRLPTQPFTDDDTQLLAGGGHDYDQTPIPVQFRKVRSRTWSRAIGVHGSDVVVGDPARPAAFVAEPAGLPVAIGSTFYQPVRRIEAVTATGQRRTFLTAERARRLLSLSGRVELLPLPAPDGSAIAVSVREVSGSRVGVIVLDHAGSLRDTFMIPSSASGAAWSRSGSLAVVTSFPDQLLIWRGGDVRRFPLRLPTGELFDDDCQWSPDARVVLCMTSSAGHISHWLLLRLSDGRQQVVNAPGLPLAWLGEASR